jgi:hypothetical protein
MSAPGLTLLSPATRGGYGGVQQSLRYGVPLVLADIV